MFKSFEEKLAVIFIAFIVVFSFGSIIMPDKGFSAVENRVLEQRPTLTPATYIEGRFEKKAETYVNDQFMLRSFFVKCKTALDLTIGKLNSGGVYKSGSGYLIDEIEIPSAKNKKVITDSLKSFSRNYPHIKSYFLIAPTVGNIMKHKLPLSVKLKDQNAYMDQMFKDISNAGITPIDVREEFMANKNSVQLYYHTDHHWTTTGAYIAFNKAKETMSIDNKLQYKKLPVRNDFRGTLASKSGFPDVTEDTMEIYVPDKPEEELQSVIFFSEDRMKTTSYYQFDNLDKKDAYTVFGGWNHPYYTIKTPTDSTEKLLLVKDSYANCFIPFLTQGYREIVVVDPRYFFGSLDEIIKREGITQTLFLYNANTLANDESLSMMLTQ